MLMMWLVSKLCGVAAADARRVTAGAWAELAGAYGGGPELTDGDTCAQCLAAALQGVADAQAGSAAREKVLRVRPLLLAASA